MTRPDLKALAISHRRAQAQAIAAAACDAPGLNEFIKRHAQSTRRMTTAGIYKNTNLRIY